MNIIIPEILKENLDTGELLSLKSLLSFLESNKLVDSIFLTGSTDTKSFDSYSDVDICIVTKSNQSVYSEFLGYVKLEKYYLIIEQGFYNWLGQTLTVSFSANSKRTYDLGFIEKNQIDKLFWDMSSVIIYDPNKTINNLLLKLSKIENISIRHLPSVNTAMFIICFIKIRKYLCRNHIWAAINSLNQLRYYTMLFYRIMIVNNKDFKGRVEKGIEKVIPPAVNTFFTSTVSVYDKKDIAKKSLILYDFIKDNYFHAEYNNDLDIKCWFYDPQNYIIEEILKSSYEGTI